MFSSCAALCLRLAYRLLAMELNSALEKKFGNWKTRCVHKDELLRNSSIVVWLLRNSVAHNILDPVWSINDPVLQNRQSPITNILTFDTTGLNGQSLERFHFGGPIALFRLSETLLPLGS